MRIEAAEVAESTVDPRLCDEIARLSRCLYRFLCKEVDEWRHARSSVRGTLGRHGLVEDVEKNWPGYKDHALGLVSTVFGYSTVWLDEQRYPANDKYLWLQKVSSFLTHRIRNTGLLT